MAASFVALLALLTQGAGLEPHAEDPLHHWTELEVGPGGSSVRYRARHAGGLHVWATSEDLDPMLSVEIEGKLRGAADDDSGGGTAAWMWLEVQSGDEIVARVSPESEATGPAELHLVAAPETDLTRSTVSTTQAELQGLQDQVTNGRIGLDEARARILAIVNRLRSLEGGALSDRISAVLWNAGIVSTHVSAVEVARSAWEGVWAHRARVLPPAHPDLLRAQTNLAQMLARSGELERAHGLFEEVCSALQRTRAEDDPDLLVARENLAVVRNMRGDVFGAHEVFEELYRVRRGTSPPADPVLLASMQNLSITRALLGDLAGALVLEEQVLDARRRTLSDDAPEVLEAMGNLAVTRAQLGDLVGARELLEQARAAWLDVARGSDVRPLRALQNLATVRAQLGDLEGAVRDLRSVRAAWRRVGSDEHPEVLLADQSLARIHKLLGQYEEARSLEESLVRVRERTLRADHPQLLAARQGLAITCWILGERTSALELLRDVHQAHLELLPTDHPSVLEDEKSLALMEWQRGDVAQARAWTASLLERQRDVAVSLHLAAPRVCRTRAALELQRLSIPLSVATAEGLELDPALFSALETLRGASIGPGAVAREAANDARVAHLRGQLTVVGRELADLVLAGPAGADPGAWREQIFELSERRDRAERDLRARLTERGVGFEDVTVAAVARRLPPDAALVSLFRYRRHAVHESGATEPALGVASLVAFVVGPRATIERVELGPIEPVEAAVRAWRAGIEQSVAGRGIAPSAPIGASTVEAGVRLRQLVVDPLLAEVPEARALYVVPDGALHLVPLDALPLATDRVGDRLRMHVLPAASILLDAPPSVGGEVRLVAVGGVDYEADPSSTSTLGRVSTSPPRRTPGGTIHRPLPGTLEEVNTVASLFERKFGKPAVLLRGARASKAGLIESSSRTRYLHVATHGWFVPESDAVSLLDSGEQGNERYPMLARAEQTIVGFSPGSLCGIALAGANGKQDAQGRVPGVLTAEELSTLDLTRCELAVLSACETNVGIRRAGQGIQSLQTALHAAGARTAITSLWKVDDAATRKLFERFYTYLWVEELGTADALWRAKGDLRAEGHPVRDWAAWVLSGE